VVLRAAAWVVCTVRMVPCTAVAQWLSCCATNRKVAGSIPGCVSGFFIDIKFFRSHYGPGVPRVFPGGKGGRCVRLTTLPLSCAVVTKSRNLNVLELSGPVQACNGTALPFLPTSKPYTMQDPQFCALSIHSMQA